MASVQEFEVIAETRREGGKGPIRRMRRGGRIPAVIYGAGKESASLVLDANRIHRQLENETFFSHILTVTVDGEQTQAVLKSLPRDPTTNKVTHIDFLRVSSTQEITMNVPLRFVNEEECPGKRHGGVVSRLLVDVEVSCLPKDLPEFIEVDMIDLDIGDALHLSQLVVPDGVRLLALAHDAEHDQPVVSVQHPQKLEEEEVEAAAEEGELEPGAEAAAPVEGEAPAPEGGGTEQTS